MKIGELLSGFGNSAVRITRSFLSARVGDGGGAKVNSEKIAGAYTGDDPAICLSTPIISPAVRVTVDLMGCPFFESSDGDTQRLLNMFADWARSNSAGLHRAALLNGTVWPWVRYNPSLGRVVIEVIGDGEVNDYADSREQGCITAMLIKYQERKWAKGFTENSREIIDERIIDPIQIQERREGRTTTVGNILGTMPYPMAIDEINNNWRGVGVYERIYPTAKSLHNVIKRMVEVAGKYKPKLIQTLANSGPSTAQDWLDNQSAARGVNKAVIDPLTDELFINIARTEGIDTTTMLNLPSDVFNGYITIIKQLEHNIVMGSGQPPLFWGETESQNYASADIGAELGARFIRGKRLDVTTAWHKIAEDYCKAQGYILGITPDKFLVRWQEIDLVGANARASNFASFASAITSLIGSKALTKDNLFYFYKKFYPDSAEKSADEMESNMLAFANTLGQIEGGEPTDAGWGA
jgi:hypothetical protein